MLGLYWASLAIGGTLLVASVATGGDNHGGDSGDAGLDAWLPIAQLRFWTFFATFFGLTGVLVTIFGPAALPTWGAGALAGVLGYGSGLGVSRVVGRLRGREIHSGLGTSDTLGAQATVTLEIAPGQPGKIRLQLKGRTIDMTANTDESFPLKRGQAVLVYAVDEQGIASVALDPARALEKKE